ncbi:MAG: type I-F CRISPR-associated protein Csy3 [Methylotenera sp.]|uniref:type I-F CRISPR-associated protein Csy3 n=1 Tax=Methylotenera sp. TaxID=2051956 RepID=UPI000D427DDC|nr:type I-F CRISPR-associated protein Csy3 [Methylotenera sp.]PPC84690.1 MAG: type I-F CRISPR-associated protein Csy3 [Methylotenera sp.]
MSIQHNAASFKKLPGVFAFSKSIILSDALMHSIDADGNQTPVYVVRNGIIGTQNLAPDTAKPYGQVSNLKITESAKLSPNAKGFAVSFSLKMTPLALALHSCSGTDASAVRKSVEGFIERATVSDGAMDVCLRYARNIANGKWLWRNRNIANHITIEVSTGEGELVANFDAKHIPMHKFDQYSKGEYAIANLLMDNLSGKSYNGLKVVATVNTGIDGNIEVFPSQNYVENKPQGYAKSLYKVNPQRVNRDEIGSVLLGEAAIRDQKISNALRSFDTWYSDFNEIGVALPVEANGASLEFASFFRKSKNGSFFDSLKNLNNLDENSDEGKFVIACMMRGGVFGESDAKEKEKEKAKAKREADNDGIDGE